ncbi:MAG: hypothetical protein QMC67_02800 [Candidatus Wallbacteria bacterium]
MNIPSKKNPAGPKLSNKNISEDNYEVSEFSDADDNENENELLESDDSENNLTLFSKFETSENVNDGSGNYKLPEKIKINVVSPLEYFNWLGIFCSCILCALLFFDGSFGSHKHGHYHPPQTQLLHYLPYSIAAFFFFAFAAWKTDIYYVLNTREKKVYYHFKFFFYESVTPFLTCDNILAIGVTGEEYNSQKEKWWSYKICMVAKNGEIIDFGNSQKEACALLNAQAKGLARLFQCKFAECPGASYLRVKPVRNSFDVYFGSKNFFEGINRKTLPIIITVTIIVITIIYSLVKSW